MLNSTAECLGRKRIHIALILVSCDIPATQKLYGHISALVSCHQYEKNANYVNRNLILVVCKTWMNGSLEKIHKNISRGYLNRDTINLMQRENSSLKQIGLGSQNYYG